MKKLLREPLLHFFVLGACLFALFAWKSNDALLTFNVGVEVGQLMFVAAVLALRFIGARLFRAEAEWLPVATAYGIGSLAVFWTIERIVSF